MRQAGACLLFRAGHVGDEGGKVLDFDLAAKRRHGRIRLMRLRVDDLRRDPRARALRSLTAQVGTEFASLASRAMAIGAAVGGKDLFPLGDQSSGGPARVLPGRVLLMALLWAGEG